MGKITESRVAVLREALLEFIDQVDGDLFVLSAKVKPTAKVIVLGKNSTQTWIEQARRRRQYGIDVLEGRYDFNKNHVLVPKEKPADARCFTKDEERAFEAAIKKHYATEDAAGCICKGNWRAIMAETRPYFDKKFAKDGREYTLVGVVDASDDYYYLMVDSEGKSTLLSCVGSIVESHGYKPVMAKAKKL